MESAPLYEQCIIIRCLMRLHFCRCGCAQSVIGDTSKAALRNARKVEQFIVEQLQKIIQTKLVFPNLIPARLPAGAAGL